MPICEIRLKELCFQVIIGNLGPGDILRLFEGHLVASNSNMKGTAKPIKRHFHALRQI